jgi:5'-3' exonuclease
MRVLIIDGLNVLFIRNWIVNPSLSSNGAPIGGIVGAFKSLQKLGNESSPDKIIICWDGSGGSRKKRQQNKNYKQGRVPFHLNRSTKVMSETEELENKIWQQTRLFEYINCLPIIQFIFDDTEADDIISCLHLLLKDDEKVVVSSDKDFLQICDKKTILYRPVQDEILTEKKIVEKYGIHPVNICLARAISGDKSDNLSGVGGISLEGIKTRFPFLKESKFYTVQDIVEFSKEKAKDSKIKVYKKVLESKDLIIANYKLMQLKNPNMSVDTKQRIEYVLDNVELEFNKSEFVSLMIKDGWGTYNFSSLFFLMNKILKKQSEV